MHSRRLDDCQECIAAKTLLSMSQAPLGMSSAKGDASIVSRNGGSSLRFSNAKPSAEAREYERFESSPAALPECEVHSSQPDNWEGLPLTPPTSDSGRDWGIASDTSDCDTDFGGSLTGDVDDVEQRSRAREWSRPKDELNAAVDISLSFV